MPRLIYTVARYTLHVARCLLSLVATCHTVVSCLSVASCLLRQLTRPSARTARRQLVPPRSRVAKRRGKAKGFSSICKGKFLSACCTHFHHNAMHTRAVLSSRRSLSLSRRLCLGVVSLRSGVNLVCGGDLFSFCRFVYVFRSFFHLQPAFFLALSLSLRNHLICWSRGASLAPPK